MKELLKNKKSQAALVGVGSLAVASSASADTMLATVTTAIADAQAIMDLIGPGVVLLAATMMGVGLIVSWLRK
jgi:hypothetical protein